MQVNGVQNNINYKVDNSVKDKTIEADSKETTSIQYRNEYVSQSDKMYEAIRKKYEKVAKENSRICSTIEELGNYIWQKYYGKNTPRYRGDGPDEEERSACYWNEFYQSMNALEGTEARTSCDYRDPVIGGSNLPASIDIARKNQHNRNMMNTQIADLFAQNGINVPEGVNLRFTINPNGYQLTVNGTEDESLIKSIEEILNRGENAKNIYQHMLMIQDGNTGQFSERKLSKYYLNRAVEEYTGYRLEDLKLENGKFYTEDGIDIYELIMNSPEVSKKSAETRSKISFCYSEQLREVAKYYSVTDDLVLNIDYKNGSLYDVDQRKQYGVGETDWIDDMAKDFTVNSR